MFLHFKLAVLVVKPLGHYVFKELIVLKIISLKTLLNGPKRYKFEGARSGLYGGCFKIVKPHSEVLSAVG